MPAVASSRGRLILRSEIGFLDNPISGFGPGGAFGCSAIISPRRRSAPGRGRPCAGAGGPVGGCGGGARPLAGRHLHARLLVGEQYNSGYAGGGHQ